MGLEAQVLTGVDGRDGLPVWAEAEVDRNAVWTWDNKRSDCLTDGELACALSHVRAYRKIVDEGLPGAIVFEDDAILSNAFKRFIDAFGYEAGQIVLLGHSNTCVRRFPKKRLCEGVVGHRLAASPVGAYGYSLSYVAAVHILEKATPVRARADWPCDISRLKSLAADPQIVLHPEDQAAQSLLDAGRRASRQKTKRPKSASRYISGTYWMRILRKRLGRRIA